MSLKNSVKKAHQAKKLKRILNWYGPYLGAGVKIEYIADDWREVKVSMAMKWYNRNAVGTHFGGSLYAMIDPHYMLMLMKLLGEDYVVWDKAAHIDFIKPGTGTVSATMNVTDDMLKDIKNHTAGGEKYLPEYPVDITNEAGELVARCLKTLYIRKKPPSNKN